MNLGSLGEDLNPEKTAFISLPEKVHYTYADIKSISDTVAADLSEKYKAGDRVALMGVNSAAYIATFLGILKAGMIAVPVNWKLPAAQIHEVLGDSDSKFVFSDLEFVRLIPESIPFGDFEKKGRRSFHATTFQPEGKDPAFMLYTSGSTGKPKGVVLSHQAHLWTAHTRSEVTPLTHEVTLIAAPLFHMQALSLALLVLASGGTAVILPQFTIPTYLQAIENYRCSYITAVPPMIEAILRDKLIHEADLSSVRTVRLGSAPIAPSLYGKIADIMPDAKVAAAYGTTESGPVTFTDHPDGLEAPAFSAGYAHPDVSLRLNSQRILEIKSPGLMNHYHNRLDLSPFTDDGYYITGDVFERDSDGFYTFMGRLDDMFVCGGENIYPGEVEKVLSQHPSVQASCVVPIDDEIKGKKPVAYVIKKGDLSEEELKQYVLLNAAAYAHPRKIWFVNSFPVTAANKIDRKILISDAAQRMAG